MTPLIEEPHGFKLAVEGFPPFGALSVLFTFVGPDQVELLINLGGIIRSTRTVRIEDLAVTLAEWEGVLNQVKERLRARQPAAT